MTVQNQTKKVTGLGNGSARTFSFSPIVVNANSELVVTKVDANSVETTLSEGSSSTTYSVAITGSLPGTGSIDYPASGGTLLVTGEKIVIKRVLTLEQQTDLENQGGYFPEVQETAFDKLVMIALQQQEEIDRSIRLAVSVVSSFDTELPSNIATLAGLGVVVNAAGTGLSLAATITGTTVDSFWVTILDDTTLDASIVSMGGAHAVNNAVSKKGADVVSATALGLGTDGNYFDVTGTTTITSIDTLGAGSIVRLHFDAAVVLTHHATNLILSGGANITTAAGDEFTFVEYATGNWRMIAYTLTSGEAIVGNPMTTQGDIITGAASGVPQRLALGSNGTFLKSDGTDAVWGTANGLFQSIQIFTSSGTWTKPAGLVRAVVEVVAGGGGGGGSSTTDNRIGGGGAGGGYAIELLETGALGATETVTIGAAGAAGTSTGAGGAGGTTSFGSLLSATGGSGGAVGATTGAAANPGAGTGGDINISGGHGEVPHSAGVTTNAAGGVGGSSAKGWGLGGRGDGVDSVGVAASGHGGGGGGGATDTVAQAGSAGTVGIIVVTEYYTL